MSLPDPSHGEPCAPASPLVTPPIPGEVGVVPWRAERVWVKHQERIPDRWEWMVEDDRGVIATVVEDEPEESAGNAQLIARLPLLLAENERLRGHGTPTPTDLVRELRDALDLYSGALDCTPKDAWNQALSEVRRLVRRRPDGMVKP